MVDVVLPVFGLILAGSLAGRFAILGAEGSEALNRFVYFFALPALLFLGMARVPVGQYGLYVERASTIILGSTVLSVVTLSAVVATLEPVHP
ncbi:MAG: AEC family transporter [Pseudomonadota bacterium]